MHDFYSLLGYNSADLSFVIEITAQEENHVRAKGTDAIWDGLES